jgi:hypothetical protein
LRLADEDYSEGNVAAVGDDTIHLVWHGRVGTGGTFHQWSADGGLTWSEPIELFGGAGLTGAPALSVDSAGTLHLAEVSSDGLLYTWWTEGTWATPVVVDDAGYRPHQPALVISEGNRLHLVWHRVETGEIAYSSRLTPASYVPPKPMPTLTTVPTAVPTVVPTAVPTLTLELLTASTTPPPQNPSVPETPAVARSVLLVILVGIVPVGILILVVVLVTLDRQGRGWRR